MKIQIDIETLPDGGLKADIRDVSSIEAAEVNLYHQVYDNKLPGFCAKLTRRIKAIHGEGKAEV